MKYFKKMSVEDFGKYLLTVPFGKEICFALDYRGEGYEDELAMGQVFDANRENDFEVWYFVKGIEIEYYQSRFLLCDYAGGEEAFAIPVSSMGSYPTGEDREFVPRFWLDCWNQIKDRNGYYNQDYVFVEIGED